MIEVIYKEEKQEAAGNEGMFAVPRNIRQIGTSREDYRIYMEDYVYTFLTRLAGADPEKEGGKGHLAVFTGETKWQSGATYVFIRGVLTVDKAEAAADHIDFTDKAWKKLHDEQELYFTGQEIVGWFFSQSGLLLEAVEVFKRAHLKYFGGGEKLLMLMDPAEREEAFFRYENNYLVRQPGYYLFYEQNPQMQNYMLDKNQEILTEETENVPDKAVTAFRAIIRSKKKISKKKISEKKNPENTNPEKSRTELQEQTSVFSYAATACLAIAVLAVGVNFYRNYQSGYSEEQRIQTASAVITEEITEEKNTEITKTPSNEITPVITPTPVLSMTPTPLPEKTNTAAQEKETTAKEQEKQTQDQEELSVQKDDTSKSNADDNAEDVLEETAETSYVIRPGDTLYQISIEKYGTMDAISEICRLNGISAEQIIYPGQVIVLP